MFTDKTRQNPFLKPSPFAASTASHTPSYTSSSNLPPRYQSYKPYDEPKLTTQRDFAPRSYQNYSSYDSYKQPQAPAPKSFESKDISTILNNNPFSRSFQPSFAVEKAARDVSPNRGSNIGGYQGSTGAYEGYGSSLGSFESSRVAPSGSNARPSEPYRALNTPVRNNYLSTSSADSATTYINKIYDLEDDKVMGEAKNMSNPFLRKTLLPNPITERQVPPPSSNSYESYSVASSALKYGSSGYGYEERSKSPVFGENNYMSDKVERGGSEKYGHLNRGNTFGQEVNDYPSNRYDARPSEDNIRMDDLGAFVKTDYLDTKYDKYEYKPSREYEQPNKDYEYKPSREFEQPKKDYEYKPSRQYQYEQPKFGTKDSAESYPFSSGSMNYDRPESKQVGAKYNKENYETSWRAKEEGYNPIYDEKNIYKAEEKVRFGEDREDQSSKFDSYKGIGAKEYEFQKREPIGTSFGGYAKEPSKLQSSLVDEYTSPEDIEKKIKESKYQKLGIENPSYRLKPASSTNIVKFEDNDNDEDYGEEPPTMKKMPTRDSAEEFPRILELNGVLFHKVEVV